MRLWHYAMIEFLPDLQLKGQWRECALIADALAKNGTPNHLLVNRVTDYRMEDFFWYCQCVENEMKKRGFFVSDKTSKKMYSNILDWKNVICVSPSKMLYSVFSCFDGWHNLEYLRICYANLLEKHNGIGKSRITDSEWQVMLDGYKAITGEEYKI